MRLHRAMAATVVAAPALAGCGGERVEGNAADRAFAREMVAHHRAAVDMAELTGPRAAHADISELARGIVDAQTAEIRVMQDVDEALADAGVPVGTLGLDAHASGMHITLAPLRNPATSEPRFLTLMTAHHEGALRMARRYLREGRTRRCGASAKRCWSIREDAGLQDAASVRGEYVPGTGWIVERADDDPDAYTTYAPIE